MLRRHVRGSFCFVASWTLTRADGPLVSSTTSTSATSADPTTFGPECGCSTMTGIYFQSASCLPQPPRCLDVCWFFQWKDFHALRIASIWGVSWICRGQEKRYKVSELHSRILAPQTFRMFRFWTRELTWLIFIIHWIWLNLEWFDHINAGVINFMYFGDALYNRNQQILARILSLSHFKSCQFLSATTWNPIDLNVNRVDSLRKSGRPRRILRFSESPKEGHREAPRITQRLSLLAENLCNNGNLARRFTESYRTSYKTL